MMKVVSIEKRSSQRQDIVKASSSAPTIASARGVPHASEGWQRGGSQGSKGKEAEVQRTGVGAGMGA